MATWVTDPSIEEAIRAQRAQWGGDRHDEVWEGIYVMTPFPNNEHIDIATEFTIVLRTVLRGAGLGSAFAGGNVSDREEGWERNFRGPDVVVVLNGSRAKDCGTHWSGGPDFLIEIASPYDHTREKIPFYGQIGVRELLIVDRDPWSLDLYRLDGNQLRLEGRAVVEEPSILASAVLPLSFRLIPGANRPQIEVTHRDGVQRWMV